MTKDESWKPFAIESVGPTNRLGPGQGSQTGDQSYKNVAPGSAGDYRRSALFSLYDRKTHEFELEGRLYRLECIGHEGDVSQDVVVASCIRPREREFNFPDRDYASIKGSLFELGIVFFDEPLASGEQFYAAQRRALQEIQYSVDDNPFISQVWANRGAQSVGSVVQAELEGLFGSPFKDITTYKEVRSKNWLGREKVNSIPETKKERNHGVPNVIGAEVRYYFSEGVTPAALESGRPAQYKVEAVRPSTGLTTITPRDLTEQ